MHLQHSFTVPLSLDEAWRALTDVGATATCVPGAAIGLVDGTHVTGSIRVKLGPLNLTYRGAGELIETDVEARRLVVRASGEDVRGNGTASVVVSAALEAESAEAESAAAEYSKSESTKPEKRTRVQVETELELTGKPAGFSHSVMSEVGARLVGQFADNLTAAAGGTAPPATNSLAKKSAAKKVATKKAPAKKAPAKKAPAARSPAKEAAAAHPSPVSATAAKKSPVTAPRESAEAPSTPAFATPASPIAPNPDEEPSVNGHSTSAPAAAASKAARVPAGLVKAAQPYLAKSIGPAAVGLVIVLAVARRRRGKRG